MIYKTVQEVCKQMQEDYDKCKKNQKKLTKKEYDEWNTKIVNKALSERPERKKIIESYKLNQYLNYAKRCKY